MVSAISQPWLGVLMLQMIKSLLEAQHFHHHETACCIALSPHIPFSQLVAVVTAMQDRREGFGGEGSCVHWVFTGVK